jgi:hypothetical protein
MTAWRWNATTLLLIAALQLLFATESPAQTADAPLDTAAGASPPGRLNIRFTPTALKLKAEFVDANGNQALDADEKAHFVITLTNLGPGKAYRPQISGRLNESPGRLTAPSLNQTIETLEPGISAQARMDLHTADTLIDSIARFRFEAAEAYGRQAPPGPTLGNTRPDPTRTARR